MPRRSSVIFRWFEVLFCKSLHTQTCFMSQDSMLMTLGAVQRVNVCVCVSEAESASQEWALTEVWWTTLTIDHKERRFCLHERALCYMRSAVDDSQADITDLVRLWVGSHALRQQLTAHALMETKKKSMERSLRFPLPDSALKEWQSDAQWVSGGSLCTLVCQWHKNSSKIA